MNTRYQNKGTINQEKVNVELYVIRETMSHTELNSMKRGVGDDKKRQSRGVGEPKIFISFISPSRNVATFRNASFLREPFWNKRPPGSASNLINRFSQPSSYGPHDIKIGGAILPLITTAARSQWRTIYFLNPRRNNSLHRSNVISFCYHDRYRIILLRI